MAWFKKARKPIAAPDKASRVPEGLWVKCLDCSQILYNKDLETNLHVCPKCSHHFRISASDRRVAAPAAVVTTRTPGAQARHRRLDARDVRRRHAGR